MNVGTPFGKVYYQHGRIVLFCSMFQYSVQYKIKVGTVIEVSHTKNGKGIVCLYVNDLLNADGELLSVDGIYKKNIV